MRAGPLFLSAPFFFQEMASVPLLQPGQWSQIAIARVADDSLLGDVGIFIDAAQARAEIGFTVAAATRARASPHWLWGRPARCSLRRRPLGTSSP